MKLDVLKSGGKTEDDSGIQENGSSDNVDGSCSQQATIKVIFILFLNSTLVNKFDTFTLP